MPKKIAINKEERLVSQYIEARERINSLPSLSDLEKAILEHSTDIEHLYFSSKIEGTNLTKRQIENAIHDK